MTRRKSKKKVQGEKILDYTSEDKRFGTPEIVANYRAKRLKCNTIVEIGAGVGFQTLSFAKECKQVYAIEIDEKKAERLKKNLFIFNIKNVKVINEDALNEKIIQKLPKIDVVFVDTERPATEKERKIEKIKPNIDKILNKYGKLTKKICIEVPPQLRKINLDCEKEYVSIDNELNRLNLYFGNLKKRGTNVILLPEEKRLKNSNKKISEINKIKHKYIYEINPAVVRAKLEKEFGEKVYRYKKKVYLVSNKKIDSDFLTGYEILKISKDLKKDLKELECGKIILKNIEPKKYWKTRNDLEKDLNGYRICYLFNLDEKIIAEKNY